MHWDTGIDRVKPSPATAAPLLLVDWGTTSRRAWLVDAARAVVASREDGRGLLTVESGGWQAAFEELKQALGGGEPRLTLLAGMVGARTGWREAPYLRCPAEVADLARDLCWVEPGSVAIVPGLSWREGERAEVMRGEEVQLFGAVATGLAPADCFACLPGTHTKWVVMRDGRITAFLTTMTGELFALLRERSVLADELRDAVGPGGDFDSGVEKGLAGADLTAELFGVRAHALLGTGRIGNGAAYASGLLIGADLRAGLRLSDEHTVQVIGRGDLATLYAAALERSGYRSRRIDGGEAALAGLERLAELVE